MYYLNSLPLSLFILLFVHVSLSNLSIYCLHSVFSQRHRFLLVFVGTKFVSIENVPSISISCGFRWLAHRKQVVQFIVLSLDRQTHRMWTTYANITLANMWKKGGQHNSELIRDKGSLKVPNRTKYGIESIATEHQMAVNCMEFTVWPFEGSKTNGMENETTRS